MAREIKGFNYQSYKNEDLKRQMKQLADLGYAALPAEKFKEINEAVISMSTNYAKARICDYRNRTKCDLQLEPGIFV